MNYSKVKPLNLDKLNEKTKSHRFSKTHTNFNKKSKSDSEDFEKIEVITGWEKGSGRSNEARISPTNNSNMRNNSSIKVSPITK